LIGLVHPPLDDPALFCTPILTAPFDVVMFENNPLAHVTELTLRDLSGERFILFPRQVGPRLYDHIIALCQNDGFSPFEIVEAAPAQSIIGMAACNLRVGFVASGLQHFARPLAVFRKLAGSVPILTISIAARAHPHTNPIKCFLDIAADLSSCTANARSE
jgi:DNA-binding transcriptional LysR family regulator